MAETVFEINDPSTGSWKPVPHVDEAQMREVDRIAVQEFQLGILQMMENAGRNLALMALGYLNQHPTQTRTQKVLVVAGSGGNGGGGICAARHLYNRGIEVQLVLTKPPEELRGAARAQLAILQAAGVSPAIQSQAEDLIVEAHLVLDAILGYSLQGAPRGAAKKLIEVLNGAGKPVISLDLPSGLEATSGEPPGVCVRATLTMSLALPKTGLRNPLAGELFLADIGIPPEVYLPLGIQVEPFFGDQYVLALRCAK